MYTGKDTIDWLYTEQLQVDREWSVETERGFRWWPDDHAQTVEILGEVHGPAGEKGYYISVRTELFKAPNLGADALEAVNKNLMTVASMSGPVYDRDRGALDLCSYALVHEDNYRWINILLNVAAALQIYEARKLGGNFCDFGMENSVSGHPQNGIRKKREEITTRIPSLIRPTGQLPSRWRDYEFQKVADFMNFIPPTLMASAGGPGLSAEFPFDTFSSLCTMVAYQPHPLYGNGLLVTHRFPVSGKKKDREKWILKALSLNEPVVSPLPAGYGFGSYLFEDGMIVHAAFFPNIIYGPGLLQNLFFSSGARGMAMNTALAGKSAAVRKKKAP